MPPFRPPRERLDAIAAQALAALAKSPGAEIRDAEAAKAIIRSVLTENLRAEHALEEEVLALLHQHGQEIYEQNASFQKLFTEGKKTLAKKKGFTL
ncbi:hypothetical protein BH09SUM1_BH09SUM1_26000 [soil metagenome]